MSISTETHFRCDNVKGDLPTWILKVLVLHRPTDQTCIFLKHMGIDTGLCSEIAATVICVPDSSSNSQVIVSCIVENKCSKTYEYLHKYLCCQNWYLDPCQPVCPGEPDPQVPILVSIPMTPPTDTCELPRLMLCLMYVTVGMWPDISFMVQTLSQFLSNPRPAHWMAVKHVFWYLNGMWDLGIIYWKGGEVEPLAYSDADWGLNINDRKSISGSIFQMAGAPISWQLKKQPMVALSSMEAEYMAESLATCQIIWLQTFTSELGIPYSGTHQTQCW
jgi:hypothetical protein